MANALRELLISFGISVDTKELKKGHEEAGQLKETLLKLGEAFGVAFGLHEIKEFVQGTVEAGARVKDLSERLGVGTADLQAFQFAAGQVGVDAEGAAMSLGFLNRSIGQAVTGIGGGQVAQIFGRLGIALKDSGGHAREVSPVLNDLADAFAKLPDQQTRATYAMQLFGRQGQQLLPLLSDGSEGIAKMRAEFEELGGGMSDDFIKQAKALEDEQKKLSLSWTGLKSTIVGALIPVLQPVVEWFTKMAVGAREVFKHTDILQTAFRFATGLAVVLGLTKIAGALKSIFVNGLLAEAPLLVMGVAAGVLYLAFDELWTLLKGGDSVIGDALGPDKKKFVDDLKGAIDDLTGGVTASGQAASGASSGWQTFKDVIVGVEKVLAGLIEGLDWVVDKLSLVTEFFQSWSTNKQTADTAWEAVKARWADEGTGGHENIKALRARHAAEAQSTQDAEDKRQDQENAKEQWMVAARYRKEYEDKLEQWKQGGSNPANKPVMQPELADFFKTHDNPWGTAAYLPPSAGMGPAPLPGQGTTINQTNNNSFQIQTTNDDPNKLKEPLSSAVATGTQRANEKALRTGDTP